MRNHIYPRTLLIQILAMCMTTVGYCQSAFFIYHEVSDNKVSPAQGSYGGSFVVNKAPQKDNILNEDLLVSSKEKEILLLVEVFNKNGASISSMQIDDIKVDGGLLFSGSNDKNIVYFSYSGDPQNGSVSFRLSSPAPDSFVVSASIPFSILSNEGEMGDKLIKASSLNKPEQNKVNDNDEFNNRLVEAKTLEEVIQLADEYEINEAISRKVNALTADYKIQVELVNQLGSIYIYKFLEHLPDAYIPYSPVTLSLEKGNPQLIKHPNIITNSGLEFEMNMVKPDTFIFSVRDKYGKMGSFKVLPATENTKSTITKRINETREAVNIPTERRAENEIPTDESVLARGSSDTVIDNNSSLDSQRIDTQRRKTIQEQKTEILYASLISNALFLQVTGKPPFILHLTPQDSEGDITEHNRAIYLARSYLVDTLLQEYDHPSSFVYAIPRDSLEKELSGSYKLFIQDADKLGHQYQEIIHFDLESENKFPWTFVGLGVLSGLFLIMLVLRNLKQRDINNTRQELEDSVSPGLKDKVFVPPPEKMVIKPRNQRGYEESSTTEYTALKNEKSKNEGPPKIYTEDINVETKGKGYDPDELENSLLDGNYCKLNMKDLWSNTAVEWVVWDQNCLKELDQFIKEHNNADFLEENADGIPEIGGFLLGKYSIDKVEEKYWVLLKKFVPVKAVQQGRYQIEFGVAWAGNQLAEVQDQFKDLETIGWFHTHPGHGLFLSHADLNIHQGFFQKRYQLAIEIDTISADLDTAVFPRTKDGSINNARDLHPDVSWFRWKDILQGANIS